MKEGYQVPEVDQEKMEIMGHLENLESASGRFRVQLLKRFSFRRGKNNKN